MKLLIVYPYDLFGKRIGGGERFIQGLVKYAPREVEIEFLGTTTDPAARPVGRWSETDFCGKKVRFFPVIREKEENRKKLVPISLKFSMALLKFRIDTAGRVILFNRIEPAVCFLKTYAPKVAVVHTDVEKQIQRGESEVLWSRMPFLYFPFEKTVLYSMTYVYCVNKKTLDFYAKRYPGVEDRLVPISTWADSDIFHPTDQTKSEAREILSSRGYYPPARGMWVLFVGRLQKVKAPLRLIEAFAAYRKIERESFLLIAGDGNLRAEAAAKARSLGVENYVYFLGDQPADTVAALYRASDVLVLVSNFEAMPMCVLEALNSGLPVVSTDVGEVKFIVKSNFSGEIAESPEPGEIALRMRKVTSSPSMYTKENCVKSVEEYSPENSLKGLYSTVRVLGAR
jgi:glycosyltransferase involved in cell wall biosynthesis